MLIENRELNSIFLRFAHIKNYSKKDNLLLSSHSSVIQSKCDRDGTYVSEDTCICQTNRWKLRYCNNRDATLLHHIVALQIQRRGRQIVAVAQKSCILERILNDGLNVAHWIL